MRLGGPAVLPRFAAGDVGDCGGKPPRMGSGGSGGR